MFKFRLLLRSQLPHRGKCDYGALIWFTFFVFHDCCQAIFTPKLRHAAFHLEYVLRFTHH